MRPLAIAVVMVGVVLLALGTWLILRASIGSPRKPRPARPAARPAPPPAPQVADRPRTAIAFPPAAVARRSAPVEDAPWQRPELELRRPEEELVAEAVPEPLAPEEPVRDEVPAAGPADERVGPDEELATEAAALDLPAGAAAWGSPVPPVEEVPVEEVPVEEVPVDEVPVDEVPVEEPPAEEPPAEEPPVEEPSVEEPSVEEPSVEPEPVAAETPAPQEQDEAEQAPPAGDEAPLTEESGKPPVESDGAPEVAPRSSFADSLAAQADESHEQPGPTPPVPPGDAVMPMGTVLGGSGAYPPLPPPQTPPPPPAPPAEQEADPLQDWARERPAAPGHQLGPVVGQQGPLPDLGATPPGGETDDDWAARFGALAEQLGEPSPPDQSQEPSDEPWRGGPGPDESATSDFPGGPVPPREPEDWRRREPHQPDEPGGRRGEPFGRPYGQQPGPPPTYRPAGPEPPRPQEQGPQTPRAASRQAGTRSHRGRPEDPRQAAVYDALTINEQVLDEVWTSPSVDVLKVVSSIVVNALDAYEDDPAEYADWVAVHRTGNCDCH